MANKIINTTIVLRHDTSTNWAANNPTLKLGEMGIETNTKKFKFGDGTTAWNSLGYAGAEDAVNILKGADTVDGSVAKSIKDAIAALDVTDTAVDGQFVTSVTETDGKITVTRADAKATATNVSVADSGNLITATNVEGALAEIAGNVATNTSAITTLNGADTVDGSVAKSVKDAVAALDGSATIASVSEGVVTLKAGMTETDGVVANNTEADITLAKVATTGKAEDISVADTDNKITATTVEGALSELATMISSSGTAGVVTCAKSTPEGVAARYTFSQGGTAIANAVIDIPKDMVVSSGTVETKGAPGADDEWPSAGTYLVLTLANATSDKVYINVGDLIEYVTSGSESTDAIVIAVDADHKVTASITDGTIALSKLTSAVQTEINKAHEHSNKDLLDTYTQTEANLADAVAKKHEHSNQSVLDGITAEKVEAWDDAAETIASTVETEIATLDYTDTAVAGQYVSAVNEADGVISVTRVALPTATAAALGMVQVDDSSIQVTDAGIISVKAVSTDLLTQGTDTLVLNGGTSA